MNEGRAWIIVAAIILTGVLAAGIYFMEGSGRKQSATISDEGVETGSLWRTAMLRDVVSGEEFSLDQFGNKPVLVLTFTVSCPIYRPAAGDQCPDIIRQTGFYLHRARYRSA